MFENLKRWFFQNSKSEKEGPLNLYDYKFKDLKKKEMSFIP